MSSTVTIEFERMPDVDYSPVKIAFYRTDRIITCIVLRGLNPCADAICHPSDTFSWEVGIRLCAKRAATPEIYRAFRRWMWLAKMAHECRHVIGCASRCKFSRACVSNLGGLTEPKIAIIIEYGKVTVDGDIPEELAWMKSVEVKE